MTSLIVIDANITLAQVLPLPYSDAAILRAESWRQQRVQIAVPTLWEYEVVSALSKAVHRKILTPEEAHCAINSILMLGFEQIPPSVHLDQRALEWAGVLGQANAYDSQYLALAETLGASFWSADRRLVNGIRHTGATWASWIGER